MTNLPPEFAPLEDELRRCAEAGLTMTFWWRDDDAIYPSAALDRLLAITERFELRPLLAVIPAKASPVLAERLSTASADIAQHGYAHANRAPRGQKPCEFPDSLDGAEAWRLLRDGHRRMDALFGRSWLPIFVPPWNRFADKHVPLLRECRFAVYSGSVPLPAAPPGLRNLHSPVDIMQWRPERRFAGTEACVARLVREIAARREGSWPREDPIGLVTHHLVHDEGAWDFLEVFCESLAQMPASSWKGAAQLIA